MLNISCITLASMLVLKDFIVSARQVCEFYDIILPCYIILEKQRQYKLPYGWTEIHVSNCKSNLPLCWWSLISLTVNLNNLPLYCLRSLNVVQVLCGTFVNHPRQILHVLASSIFDAQYRNCNIQSDRCLGQKYCDCKCSRSCYTSCHVAYGRIYSP